MLLPKTGNIRMKAKKAMFDRLIALVLIVLLLPVFIVLSLMIVLVDDWPFWFSHQRLGKDRRKFQMWKFRTMVGDAERIKKSLTTKNEADGPVFKIHDDPRFTRLGKYLSHTGIDELPQLINILKGEMSFVGPRPLPVSEAEKIPGLYGARFKVNPGIISPWVVGGYHRVGFNRWMESDVWYVKNKSLWLDLKLCFLTIRVVLRMLKNEVSVLLKFTKH